MGADSSKKPWPQMENVFSRKGVYFLDFWRFPANCNTACGGILFLCGTDLCHILKSAVDPVSWDSFGVWAVRGIAGMYDSFRRSYHSVSLSFFTVLF